MPPFVFLNQLQICSAEKKYALKKYGNYDPLLLKFLALPQAIMFFLILGRNLNICGRYNLFFCSSLDFGAPLTKGPKRNFCPSARNFSRRPWLYLQLHYVLEYHC